MKKWIKEETEESIKFIEVDNKPLTTDNVIMSIPNIIEIEKGLYNAIIEDIRESLKND